MATLTMTPPTRQPFASLDSPRMRSLMRSKLNRQNQQAGTTISAKPAFFVDDAENIDPIGVSLSAKRKRTGEEDDETGKGSPKPLNRVSTPLHKSLSTPRSAPILRPAGRSPPSKSSKSSARPVGRGSTTTKPRPEPIKRGGVTRPFSLATALSQGKATPKPPSQSKSPASWFFDIHVDSEQEEMTNLMQHSTGVLDISDDESKAAAVDSRGKENVPPTEWTLDNPPSHLVITRAAAAARKVSQMEEDRAPLGELPAADFYAEGCHAFSFVVVDDEEVEKGSEAKKIMVPLPPSQAIFVPPTITASIASLLGSVAPPRPVTEAFPERSEE
ncbi:hypothetical protein N7462_010952 [Penicillium macrosclerotiorum]|uniref:uncharacterized protein n=1 Tax=Penicillium macrosclerotiorum TaxID=303699 RepID=UPI002548056D|nr:uncharacterized protein N7462_010952 [Penicillium macrosclerotiorum]KAJ5669882.1 hypothetical protein N7462_010952 [Penicillium macrosclerotiorum]